MKTDYHSILRRQLKRLSLTPDTAPEDLESWRKFLTRVSGCYQQSDEDRYLIERSLELSPEARAQPVGDRPVAARVDGDVRRVPLGDQLVAEPRPRAILEIEHAAAVLVLDGSRPLIMEQRESARKS